MELSFEYNQQEFGARSHWVCNNSNVLVVEYDRLLSDEWNKVVQVVAQDQKVVAIVQRTDELFTYDDYREWYPEHVKDCRNFPVPEKPEPRIKKADFKPEWVREYSLRGVALPHEFLKAYKAHFPAHDDTDRLSRVSALKFKDDSELELNIRRNQGFIEVHDLQMMEKVVIAGKWISAHIHVDDNGKPVLNPHPENPIDLEDLRL